jgi:DNA-binding MarR family transcriptional regulator
VTAPLHPAALGQNTLREKHDGAPAGGQSLRLWLRLLSCAMVIEKRIQRRLADQFGTTLPRFDILAALHRADTGLMMSALSRALLVSNGNMTALVKTLAADGHVAMQPSATDRRAMIVTLTPAGRAHFETLAAAHHGWVEAMLAGVSAGQRDMLFDLLGSLKVSIASEPGETAP